MDGQRYVVSFMNLSLISICFASEKRELLDATEQNLCFTYQDDSAFQVSDEEVESLLPAAAYALAKIHMHLVHSGYDLALFQN